MSLWVGISPLIGPSSLEGFAVGATVSGAFFLAITAPRRVRRRQAAVAGTRGVAVSAGCAETSSGETGALDAGLCGTEAFGVEVERVAQPQPSTQDDASWTSPTVAYRSRHRLGDPIPGRAARGGASAGPTPRGGAFPGWRSRDHAQPDTPFPDVASSDVAFPDGTCRSARRPEVRRLPRHAAPAVSFGSQVNGRVTACSPPGH
jgi:hypothetical protein